MAKASTKASTKASPASSEAYVQDDATHEVLRMIPGESYAPGDRVNASAWAQRRNLEDSRHLRPLAILSVADVNALDARNSALAAELKDLTADRSAQQVRIIELTDQVEQLQVELDRVRKKAK